MITYLSLGDCGRTGNCLFQVASTIGLAEAAGLPYTFPRKQGAWDYWQYFKNPPPISEDFRWIEGEVREGGFHYSPPELKDNHSVAGYLQSEKYWKHCEHKIRGYFTFTDSLISKLTDRWGSVIETNTCAIHVRRGDYLNNRNHLAQPMDYYIKAMRMLDNKTYLVFSDDIRWCKTVFRGGQFIFVDGQSDIEDLALGTLCKNFIIANSSFSWWQAYLCSNPIKAVICPKNWFGQGLRHTHNTKDLYCEGWLKI